MKKRQKSKKSMEKSLEEHIKKRFIVYSHIGGGAYGVVWRAIDRTTGLQVAIKKCFDIFTSKEDTEKLYREITLLRRLNHKNIVQLIDVIRAFNQKDIYLIFEFVDTDLHQVIKLDILNTSHHEFIIYQILCCLKYLHSGGILHRDLKPANILIDSDCNVKVADFGQARTLKTLGAREVIASSVMSGYIATRWYRAPEIVFEENKYSYAIDVWGVGCILAELILQRPLFPGNSTINQMELICDLCGKPKQSYIKEMFQDDELKLIATLNLKKRKSFRKVFEGSSKVVIHFLKKCLEMNPKKRLTVEEALNHPFLRRWRDERFEEVLDEPMMLAETKELCIDEIRKMIYKDIAATQRVNRKEMKRNFLRMLGFAEGVDGGGDGRMNFLTLMEDLKGKRRGEARAQVIDIFKEKKQFGTFPGPEEAKVNNFFEK